MTVGRPRGHVPANKGKACVSTRLPARASVPIVRELFDRMAADTDEALKTFGQRVDINPVLLARWKHDATQPLIGSFVRLAAAAGYRVVLEPLDKD